MQVPMRAKIDTFISAPTSFQLLSYYAYSIGHTIIGMTIISATVMTWFPSPLYIKSAQHYPEGDVWSSGLSSQSHFSFMDFLHSLHDTHL
jgi:hypothetical protein